MAPRGSRPAGRRPAGSPPRPGPGSCRCACTAPRRSRRRPPTRAAGRRTRQRSSTPSSPCSPGSTPSTSSPSPSLRGRAARPRRAPARPRRCRRRSGAPGPARRGWARTAPPRSPAARRRRRRAARRPAARRRSAPPCRPAAAPTRPASSRPRTGRAPGPARSRPRRRRARAATPAAPAPTAPRRRSRSARPPGPAGPARTGVEPVPTTRSVQPSRRPSDLDDAGRHDPAPAAHQRHAVGQLVRRPAVVAVLGDLVAPPHRGRERRVVAAELRVRRGAAERAQPPAASTARPARCAASPCWACRRRTGTRRRPAAPRRARPSGRPRPGRARCSRRPSRRRARRRRRTPGLGRSWRRPHPRAQGPTARATRSWPGGPSARAITWRGDSPSWHTATTCSVIGMSTSCLRARSSTERQLFTPSAVWCCWASTCSTVSPRPSRSPKVRLRDSGELHVATRSPRPGEPGEGHRVGAERDAEPGGLGQPAGDERGLGVVAEAHALGHPGGQRDDVLHRAAELAADHVGVGVRPEVRGRAGRLQPDRRCAGRRRRRRSPRAARPRSPAPGSARTPRRPGPRGRRRPRARPRSSACSVPSSTPFIRLTSTAPGASAGTTCARLARRVCDGTASTTRSAPSTASTASAVAVTVGGSTHARQVVGVLVPVAHRRGELLPPRPEHDVGPGVGQHLAERGPPRAGAEHRRSRHAVFLLLVPFVRPVRCGLLPSQTWTRPGAAARAAARPAR